MLKWNFSSIYHKREIHYEVFLTHNLSSRESRINSGFIMGKFGKNAFHCECLNVFFPALRCFPSIFENGNL